MTRKTSAEFLLPLAVLCCTALPAAALESDRNQPIRIEADKGELDQKNQSTRFSGNVIIKQGTLDIRAEDVNVSKNPAGHQFIQAKGSPVRFSQTLDDNKGTVNGSADKIDYASTDNIVRLSGNAKVTRGGDTATGALITYNTATEVYTVVSGKTASGGKEKGRAVVVIMPSTAKSGKK